MNKIRIYTNEACPYCEQVKAELTRSNIEFDELLTENTKNNWQAIVNLTGMPTVPTLNFNGNYLVPGRDFGNAANLIKLIQNYKESNFTIQEITLEKLKTLHYNISTAFNRTNQLLTKIETKINTDEHKSTN